jgi:small subunit ribosomal protein S10
MNRLPHAGRLESTSMPTLHRFQDRPGYFVRGVSGGKPVTFELTPEGEQYLTETLGLADGAKFAGDTLRWLHKKKWAVAVEAPEEEASPPPAAEPAAHDPNPVVYQGVVQIRLRSGDHVALDAAAEEVVRTLAESGAAVFGPIPLPVHIDAYTVIREAGRKVYELRLYQRLLEVRSPRRRTGEVMQEFRLPREVDLQVEMLPAG